MGFEVDERLVRSDSLHDISKGIYDQLSFFYAIRGIQEICQRRDMKANVAKYLEFYARTTYRPKIRQRPKGKPAVKT